MISVARRIVDRHVLHLIKMWLETPVEERDADGTRRMKSGKTDRRGTPQGGVISPLLAKLYMNRFLKAWRMQGCGAKFRAHLVNYADDFVILSRGHAAQALTWTRVVMTKLGLTLNETKTSLKDARTEGFGFLGYTFGPKYAPKGGQKSFLQNCLSAPNFSGARRCRRARVRPARAWNWRRGVFDRR